MCGIGAIVRTGGGSIPEAWLDALDARLAHRGPDGAGRHRDRVERDGRTVEVALVHRRLSIIDLATGDQPMVAPAADGRDALAVVFNGCIDNHRALRAELEALGHRFASDHSDTEVLLHGYRAWGAALDAHLLGMYAYALWDRAAGALHAGRDWFGEKPLYEGVATIDGDVVRCLASDAKAVADVLGVVAIPPSPAESSAYLRLGYGLDGATMWRDASGTRVRAIAPSVPAELTRVAPRRLHLAPRSTRSVERTFERLIERAVRRKLDADVPLGCFLSGGVDSSLVACFAVRAKPDLRTFSVRMPDPRYDESAHAERVASLLGTNHTTLDAAAEPARDLVHLVERLGQPFGDSSILPTYWVSRAARAHVTVVLSGDGADELFYGYDRYRAAPWLVRGRALLALLPKGLGASAHPKSLVHRLGRLGAMARDLPRCGAYALKSIVTGDDLARLLGGAESSPPTRPLGADAARGVRMADVASYLPGDLLTKVDTASMAVALEVRCPYLDRDLARAALVTKRRHLMPKGRRKGLLRAIAARLVAPEVAERPKMGFAIPIGRWFREDFGGLGTLLRERFEADEPFGSVPIDVNAARAMMREHLDGVREHDQRLFALLTLSLWARSACERDAARRGER